MTVFVAVGHGLKPGGVYDPGAVAPGGKQEHELAHLVVSAVASALTRSGVAAAIEEDSASGHDPNFVGSVRAANKADVAAAVEVHFDWSGAPPGGFGIFASDEGEQLSGAIWRRYADAGLTRRKNYARSFFFVRATHASAVIWECDRVADDHDPDTLWLYGECIAAGFCDFIGATYRSPSGEPTGVNEFPRPLTRPDPQRPSAPAFPGRLLRLRSPWLRGGDAREWQARMRERGWRIDVDGIYGPQSASVCRRFQREKGLTVDGIVGPKTWEAAWIAPVV